VGSPLRVRSPLGRERAALEESHQQLTGRRSGDLGELRPKGRNCICGATDSRNTGDKTPTLSESPIHITSGLNKTVVAGRLILFEDLLIAKGLKFSILCKLRD